MTEQELQILEAQASCAGLPYKTAHEAAKSALDRYMDLEANRRTGLRTGNNRFDSITGGLKPSNLVVIGGETGTGKTTFALNIVRYVVAQHKGVLLFSLEMDSDEIMDSLYAMTGRIDRNRFNHARFGNDDMKKLTSVMERLKPAPLFIFDEPNMTMEMIRKASLLMTAQNPIELIVVDYLQLVNTDSYRDNREQQVASISRGLKGLAKECRCPIMALSQLNEDGKVRESRGIAHDANIVMLLSGIAPDITLSVVKGRSIPKGEYHFNFETDYAQFTETGCDQNLSRRLPSDLASPSLNGSNGTIPSQDLLGQPLREDPYRGKQRQRTH